MGPDALVWAAGQSPQVVVTFPFRHKSHSKTSLLTAQLPQLRNTANCGALLRGQTRVSAPRGPCMPEAFYRRDLPHLQRDYKPHFLTFCTHHRWILSGMTTTTFKSMVRRCSCRQHVHMIFMPLIDQLRSEVIPFARITKAIKGASAHLINRQLGHKGTVWQEESFDHVLRSSEGLDQKIRYVLDNPIRHGLVQDCSEYPWMWRSPVEHISLLT
jgi:REP element-mobilizing transposase RayT